MLDLSQVVLGKFMGMGWLQLILIICLVVILIAYWMYRKKQV